MSRAIILEERLFRKDLLQGYRTPKRKNTENFKKIWMSYINFNRKSYSPRTKTILKAFHIIFGTGSEASSKLTKILYGRDTTKFISSS